MKEYTLKRKVYAEPMTLGEYNKLRGWELPADEDPETKGYYVKYPTTESDCTWMPKALLESQVIEHEITMESLVNKLNELLEQYPSVIETFMSNKQVASREVCENSSIMGTPLGESKVVLSPICVFNGLLENQFIEPMYHGDALIGFVPKDK